MQAAPAVSALAGVQRKLAVGKAGDPYEREADAVADRVMAGQPAPAISALPAAGLPSAQTKTGMEEEDTAETAQKKGEEEEAQTKGEEEEAAQTKAEDEGLETGEEMAAPEAEAMAPEEESEEAPAQAKEAEADEEPVQAKEAEPEEKKPAQAKEEAPEEKPAQAKAAEKEPEETPVQARRAQPDRTRPPKAEAERAVASPGEGRAMDPETRARIEGSTGADLSDVRVHDDAKSGRAAQALNARAFAHGRDIWLAPGESARDTRLMAHEAAHVVQQTGPGAAARGAGPASGAAPAQARPLSSPAAAVVQRAGGGAANAGGGGGTGTAPAGPPKVDSHGHSVDFTGGKKQMKIKSISLPNKPGKDSVAGPFKTRAPGSRDDDPQKAWLAAVTISDTSLKSVLPDAKGFATAPGAASDSLIFILKVKSQDSYVVGTRADIAAQSKIPTWRSNGNHDRMEVDHIKENQVGGADAMSNYQLLDSRSNRGAGNALRDEVKNRINDAKAKLKRKGEADGVLSAAQVAELDKSPDDIRKVFEVEFLSQTATKLPIGGRGYDWQRGQIESGEHLSKLTLKNAKNLSDAEQKRFLGDSSQLVIYLGRGASAPREVAWDGANGPTAGRQDRWIGQHLDLVDVGPHGNSPTHVVAEVYARHAKFKKRTIQIPMSEIGGRNYAFRLPADYRSSEMLEFNGWSPISIESFGIEEAGVGIRGKLRPTIPIFKPGSEIDFSVMDGEITLSKTFSGDEFKIPGPVKVAGSSLTLSASGGSEGFRAALDGRLDIEVDRVGKGFLGAAASTSGDFAAEGEFDFDPTLFKGADAKVKLAYKEGKFSGSGTLKIEDGQIKGIRAAEVEVKLEDDVWTAAGTVQPKVPGVSEGSLAMKFDPNGGFEITGRLVLGKDIPRLKSGHLEATLTKADDAWKLKGEGKAELDIPGVTASLEASYDDGAFMAEAKLGYEKGIAKGEVTVGASNMPPGENGGRPSGEPGETLTLWGSGVVTLRFTPWLEGTVGLKVNADGSMEVKGKVAMPSEFEVFPQKKIEKELLSIGVDIPIVGVAVMGQRIGIFITIGGSLTASASVGPGVLKDAEVEVTWNPEDESATRVTGGARFVVPAEAGLRMAITGALGAGIPIVSASAGLELGGTLGVKGEASAGATVEWTPSGGVNLDADVKVEAQPKFTFDLTGFAKVEADLLLDTVELYSKRWKLASVEYGSDMKVGAKLAVKMENSELKPINTDSIEFITPQVDPVATAKGLIRSLA
ncbi:MAG: DUF4157 domain-containing protein [Pseudomonadota bacterium]|nr:DUF4157 domain-containing protein [Pseudomonadota bacterium]